MYGQYVTSKYRRQEACQEGVAVEHIAGPHRGLLRTEAIVLLISIYVAMP